MRRTGIELAINRLIRARALVLKVVKSERLIPDSIDPSRVVTNSLLDGVLFTLEHVISEQKARQEIIRRNDLFQARLV